MTGTGPDEPLAHAFEQQRGRLVAVAHRILGSRTDAEDAVQEAWLRLARQEPGAIDNLGGWLTTVVGRVCIDLLRSRRTRPEAPYEDELPHLVVTEDTDTGPEDDALLAESVGLALMVVLDTLGPSERLAFVLHDMFAVPFEEIAEIIGTSGDAAKMLAWRARRKVQATPPAGRRPPAGASRGRRVHGRHQSRRLRRFAARARPGRDLAGPHDTRTGRQEGVHGGGRRGPAGRTITWHSAPRAGERSIRGRGMDTRRQAAHGHGVHGGR
jgi:RNA polymerase sigma factor (sigma-70 family)